ncbi:hypothetical protein AALP_AA5G063200 [Arabis alpina]|uniref:Uncharacterized protein n=1 Tax=Arabis alpina TaxID=50452 RepID=A0A087GVB0_ARAAL|nr:hypothetical protein AALP_AA5G063200 [Arabis alpina]
MTVGNNISKGIKGVTTGIKGDSKAKPEMRAIMGQKTTIKKGMVALPKLPAKT